MKAKSRRRLLISSVAMLLVAMLALGTATFAWFTTTASIDATNLGFQTTKSSYLQLSKANLQWQNNSLDYAYSGKNLIPASSANGTDWYSAVATSATSYAATSYSPLEGTAAIGTNGSNVIAEMLNIKNAGTKAINSVTITVKSVTAYNSPLMRVALVPCTAAQSAAQTDYTKYPAMSTTSGSAFKDCIYGSGASQNASPSATSSTRTVNKWYPIEKDSDTAGKVSTTEYSVKSAINSLSVNVGNMPANTVKSYRLYIWFEGQDQALFNQTNAALTCGNITFNVAGTEAA